MLPGPFTRWTKHSLLCDPTTSFVSRSFFVTLCHSEHKADYFIPLMFDRTGFPSHNSGNATGSSWQLAGVKIERPSPQRTQRSTEGNGGKPFCGRFALMSADFKVVPGFVYQHTQGLKAPFFYCSERRPKGLLFHGSGYSNIGTAIRAERETQRKPLGALISFLDAGVRYISGNCYRRCAPALRLRDTGAFGNLHVLFNLRQPFHQFQQCLRACQ